jgi:EXS family/SPX domain
MVDFGLKLEDNKVSDWSEYYIRYEILKAILKKCEAALKRYQELEQRQPKTASIVADAYRRGEPTPSSSRVDLIDLTADSRTASSSSLCCINEEKQGNEGSESKELLPNRRLEVESIISLPNYGSVKDLEGAISLSNDLSSSVIKRALVKAASDVSDYYYGRYEQKIRDSLKTIDKLETEFGETLISDVHKVNTFYKNKIEELEEQLVYLRESVQPTKDGQGHRRLSDELSTELDEDTATPLISSGSRKSVPSPIVLVRKIASWTHPKLRRLERERKQNQILMVDPLFPADKIDDDETSLDDETLKKLREAESVQRALVDYYRTAKLLQNFVIMNYTGFVKIVKKHGKTLPIGKAGKYKDLVRASNICNEGKDVEILVNRMEKLYAAWFCDKSLSEARAQILIKKGDGLEMDWSQLRLGYRMGMSVILALWVCWDCVWGLVSAGQSTIGSRTAFPVFRAFAGLIQLQWCWGISVWVWTRYRVNYIFLFDFDPNLVETPLAIFNEAVDNTLFFFLCTLLYYKAGAHDIPGSLPPGIFALIVVIYAIYHLIFPLKVRLPMWKTILKVVTTPVSSPSFFQGYVGDIFTSMVKIFQDLVWTFFFIVSGDWQISEDSRDSAQHAWSKTRWYTQFLIPIVTLLPLWFRFNQCLRRYSDTGKYAH